MKMHLCEDCMRERMGAFSTGSSTPDRTYKPIGKYVLTSRTTFLLSLSVVIEDSFYSPIKQLIMSMLL